MNDDSSPSSRVGYLYLCLSHQNTIQRCVASKLLPYFSSSSLYADNEVLRCINFRNKFPSTRVKDADADGEEEEEEEAEKLFAHLLIV